MRIPVTSTVAVPVCVEFGAEAQISFVVFLKLTNFNCLSYMIWIYFGMIEILLIAGNFRDYKTLQCVTFKNSYRFS